MKVVHKKKASTADIFKMMSLALMSLAFPVTLFLVSNQTNFRQDAAEITVYVTPTPTPVMDYYPVNIQP